VILAGPTARRVRAVFAIAALSAMVLSVTACGTSPRAVGRASARAGGSTPPASGAPGVGAPAQTVPTTAAATVPVGRVFPVGVRTDTYVDPTRPTSAVPGYDGAPSRTFPVTIWYPASVGPAATAVEGAPPERVGAPYPVLLFSHGFGVVPAFYEPLLVRWAAAGYVVVAPTYPLLSGVPAGPSHEDFNLVFADASFVLSGVLGRLGSGSTAHPLAGMVDPDRVGVAGHSDGLVTAYGMSALECCRDRRVAAVVAMAGILGNVANPLEEDTGVPVMHVMGERDELQSYSAAIEWDRENLGQPRWMVTALGGNHAAPYTSPASPHFDGVVRMTTDFFDGILRGRPASLAAISAYVAGNRDRFLLER
jgi:dienelactone hydrolase